MVAVYDVARNWWALAVRGVLGMIFGILMFALPGLTLAALVLFYGVFTFIQGIFSLAVGLTGRIGERPRWAWILGGLVSIGAGLLALFWPGIALIALLYVVAAWAIILGITEIVAAIEMRREVQGEWALILSGIVSILFGLVLALMPGIGLLTLAFLIGSYVVLWGILEVALSFRLRRETVRLERPSATR